MATLSSTTHPPERLYEGPGVARISLLRQVHPPFTGAVQATPVWVLLGEVDEAGVGEDGDGHEDEKEAELLVGLLEGVDERLQPGEVTNKFEDSQYSHYSDQADYFSCFPDNFIILQAFNHKRDIEGEYGEQVHHVHGVLHEGDLPRTDRQSNEVLHCEEDYHHVVNHLDDGDHDGVLQLAGALDLELLDRGEDEGEGGHDHHEEA